MRFQFDPKKAKKKHGISFADAEGVFYDDLAIHLEDISSEGELRFIVIGMSSTGQILVIVSQIVEMKYVLFPRVKQRIKR